MLISEIYESRQGEGLLTGTPSIFVRTSGCNLRCKFCDTPYTSWEPEGKPVDAVEIVQQCLRLSPRHVVITGGEPMLPRDIVFLTELLKDEGYHISIETAGTRYRAVQCDLMSVSPKLSNSQPSISRAGEWAERHRTTRINPPVLTRLINEYPYQLKFVVASPNDLPEILNLLESHGLPANERVLLMPEGVDNTQLAQRAEWLAPLAAEHGFRFCPRKHIEWYGNRRGT